MLTPNEMLFVALQFPGDPSSSASASATVSASEEVLPVPPRPEDFAESMNSILNGSSAVMDPGDMAAVVGSHFSLFCRFPSVDIEIVPDASLLLPNFPPSCPVRMAIR